MGFAANAGTIPFDGFAIATRTSNSAWRGLKEEEEDEEEEGNQNVTRCYIPPA